ncbi:MAG: iron(III) transport system permease protein [Chthoniobacter sp.]|nr:iron(III) transport system permease protein [Chthoniobacter sp.]
MSITAQTATALGRALVIGGIALAVSGPLRGWIAARRGRARTLAWTLLLAPFFTPPLLVSYAFSKFALALIVSPWSHEALYLGVLALKLIPVAVIVRMLMPPPLSAEAWFGYRMLAPASWWGRARFRVRGAGAGPWIAGGLVFVLAFADFELAALWSVRTWTVAIFDAQAGGLALSETLRLAAWPLGVEGAALALVAGSARDFRVAESNERQSAGRRPWIYLASAATLVCILPLAVVTAQAAAGFHALAENFVLGREIGASVLFGLVAAFAADALARAGRKPMAWFLGVPGLLGALVVSLLVLALFQARPLRFAYDTPLPLALALTLLLLPLALLLGVWWPRRTAALHVAKQVRSRRLVWELEKRPRAAAFGLLFCWAYFDFTASSILAPVGLTPVFVRLHNLAHYGQTAVLSAMMLAAFAVPVLLSLLVMVAASLHTRRNLVLHPGQHPPRP